jgi:YD repeat-containing protein
VFTFPAQAACPLKWFVNGTFGSGLQGVYDKYWDTQQEACAAAAQGMLEWWNSGPNNVYVFDHFTYSPNVTGAPAFEGQAWGVHVYLTVFNSSACPSGCTDDLGSFGGVGLAPSTCTQFYVSASPPPEAQCGLCVGDPINPGSGAVIAMAADIGSSDATLRFERFYNSTAKYAANLSAGWRHSYSRSITPRYSGVAYKAYVQSSSDNSSLHSSAASACTSGFAQIKSRVTNWANATASYANGICRVSLGATSVAILPIYSNLDAPFGGSAAAVFDAIRDNGQVVTFWVDGSSLVAPPSINLKLQQSGSGYTLTDADDAIETYDTNGKLLSIMSRAGVVQTMSYEASGRLSTVTDTFGHTLTLTYDSQGRLSTVVSQ